MCVTSLLSAVGGCPGSAWAAVFEEWDCSYSLYGHPDRTAKTTGGGGRPALPARQARPARQGQASRAGAHSGTAPGLQDITNCGAAGAAACKKKKIEELTVSM
eukprot:gene19161-biopygen23467